MAYRLRNGKENYARVSDDPINGARNPFLAANLKRLMDGRSIDALRRQMAEAGYRIGMGTLHRAVRGELGNRLESLQKIAAFFDMTPEQLLQPEEGVSPIWPFSLDLQEEVLRLDPEDMRDLERTMWGWLRKPMPTTLAYHQTQQRPRLQVLPNKPDVGDELPETDLRARLPHSAQGKTTNAKKG